MSNKRFAINMFASVFSFVTNVGIGFLLTPFVISHLGVEAYGFFGLANEFVGYAQILAIALNSMAARFITISLHQGKEQSVLEYFSSVVIANGVIALLLLIPSVFIIANLERLINITPHLLSDVSVLWSLIFATFFVSILDTAFSVATFAQNRLDLASLRKVESSFIRVAVLVLVFYFFSPKVWYLGLAALMSTLYVMVADFYYTRKLLPQVRFSFRYFNPQCIRDLLSSGLWNSFTRLSSIFSRGLDLLIVNLVIGGAAMGTLSVSRTFPTQILSLFAIIAGVFAPELTILFAHRDNVGMLSQIKRSIKMLGFFSCIPMAILFTYGDVFYSLWIPSQNASLLQTLSILICFEFVFVLPLEGLWNVFTVMNKLKFVSLYLFGSSVLSILTLLVVLQFCDSPTTKLYVVGCVSTGFSVIRVLTFLPMYGAHCLKLKMGAFYPVIIKNTIAVVVVTVFSFGVKSLGWVDSWISLALASLISTIFAIIINSVLLLEKKDRQYLFQKIRPVVK